jgi:hypothetical protein
MNIKLIEPKVYYRTESKTALPLLANYERLVFEISKQDTVLDSLIINYKYHFQSFALDDDQHFCRYIF